MVQLTVEQRTFLVKNFFETGSLEVTRERFAERFPERRPPTLKTIWANVRKFSAQGTTLNRNKGNSERHRTGRSEANIEAVRVRLAEHPTGRSARRNGVGLPSATFNRITRIDLNMHPYHIHIRHQLLPNDYARRMQLARWLGGNIEKNENFLLPFVEHLQAAFAMNGQVNTHNVRAYAVARQPPEFNYEVNISRDKLTVWIGLCGNGQIIGPFFFGRNVTGQVYLQVINNDVVPQLEQYFRRQIGGVFRNLWWVQDGAQAHRLIAVRDRLRELFGHRVIALYEDVEWPPRSPDLIPCDFFLWGYLKNKVYTSPPNDLNDFQNRIQNEVDALRNDPALIRRTFHAMRRRCELCIKRDGGHVEGIGA